MAKGNHEAEGKSTSKEISIYRKLKELTGTDTKTYYIMFKYCPEFLKDGTTKPYKTFEDLRSRYKAFSDTITEEICEKYMLEQNTQVAVKWLLERLHQKKMIELYDIFYEKAKSGDTQAFKTFMDFSDKFFTENKESGLSALLTKIPDAEIADEEEDLSYTYTE